MSALKLEAMPSPTPARWRRSLQFDVGGLGELAPLPKLARDQGGEVGQRAADRIDALAL